MSIVRFYWFGSSMLQLLFFGMIFMYKHRFVLGSDFMNGFDRVKNVLPDRLANELEKYRHANVEELRIRLGKNPGIVIENRERLFVSEPSTKQDIKRIIERTTGASYHISESEISNGYISCNGIRIGVCGNVSAVNGQVRSFRNFTSLAIRVPRECRGVCDKLLEKLFSSSLDNTLIISPPGGGKTSALREICRKLSNKNYRIAVVDERNELLSDDGTGGFDLGPHTDVLTGVSKAEGSIMLLRAMNPQIIAMDEITKECDLEAVSQIAGCGVSIIATAHASSREELLHRKIYRNLLDLGIFKNLIIISGFGHKRIYATEYLTT